ncbi:VOC family protein [Alkalinema pantanalense CENA528]
MGSIGISYTSAWVTIAALDLERSQQFYQALFACEPSRVLADRYVEFQLSDLRVGIYRPTKNSPHPSEMPAIAISSEASMSLCFQVQDLDATIAQLGGLEIPHDVMAIASHGREVYAYDPDGNRLIFYQPNSA